MMTELPQMTDGQGYKAWKARGGSLRKSSKAREKLPMLYPHIGKSRGNGDSVAWSSILSIIIFVALVLWCLTLFEGLESKSVIPGMATLPALGSGSAGSGGLFEVGLQFISTPTISVVATPSLGVAGYGGH